MSESMLFGTLKMNVYDFDFTIFPSDSSLGFCIWCMNRHPRLWFTFCPKALIYLIQRKKGKITEAEFQRKFFSYLTLINDFDMQIVRYWNKNEKRIVPWYLAQKKPDDLIISASPSCIIEPIAKRLGVDFMATEYDREYGVYLNNMMYAKEKAKYIIDRGFPMIENFYSDSLSDTPLALCAEKAHLVTNKASTVVDWPELNEETIKIVKKKIDTGWTIHLKEDKYLPDSEKRRGHKRQHNVFKKLFKPDHRVHKDRNTPKAKKRGN